ncbi:hydroxymethylbilane synthase [Symbiobacterium terraclitae]|uniref:hydroxymethylbilane synthase n=1 Tax=Symbiobacterium terraclitae TaxID=557451 RepID=UPI0035B56E34
MNVIRVATRGSLLALTQTGWVVDRLREANPHLTFETHTFKTVGDMVLDRALSQIGDKGLFTKELEAALLDGRADLAVHSLKDLPSELPEGLVLGCVPEREDPRDVVITRDGTAFADLPAGAKVGTSSLRRVAQLRAQRPDLEYVPIRGNVDTRLRKLSEGQVDALVMAAAGLHRAGFADRITEYLDPEHCLPAPGQGALGIEIRADDARIGQVVSRIHHVPTALEVMAERAILARLEGGCQVPIGAHAEFDGGLLRVEGLIASTDGSRVIRYAAEGDAGRARSLGVEVADWLLEHGGREILDAARG